jgi:hypothetical protein
MMQGKQAKIVSPIQERAILGYLATTRSPVRDQVMVLLSMKAGLRAKAMASLTADSGKFESERLCSYNKGATWGDVGC